MKDFFHLQEDCICSELAALLARFHSSPTELFSSLREEYMVRDAKLTAILRAAPLHSPCWHLPCSGIDTGTVVMGMGNIPHEITEQVFEMLVDTGVLSKVMTCESFHPV